MGLRDVPARSSSTDPSAFLAAPAPLPSAIPTGSDLSTGCSLGPELNTPCRHLSFPLAFPADAPSQPYHFPETYLPTLALPAPPGPSLSSTSRASPTPQPQLSMQTSDLISAGPHFSPRPARYFRTLRKHRRYYRPPYPGSCSLTLLQTPLSRLQAPSLPHPPSRRSSMPSPHLNLSPYSFGLHK